MTHFLLRSVAVSLAALCLHAAVPVAERNDILRRMYAATPKYGALSRRIWDWAELGYREEKSAGLLKDELRAAGFTITENVAGIPTAFLASWGSGLPVIAILGEYDALPGLSQDAVPERRALTAGAPGHGCGHNLLGVGSMWAAIEAKNTLASSGLPGTIRFYGTPAEEGGAGKIYMARAGAFADASVVLTWHPGGANAATLESSLAMIAGRFRFRGTAAHAASAPDHGRSALDAVMVMTHAVDLMREHVPESTRMHYIVTNGGAAPNIVPDFAEVSLTARHEDMRVLDGIWERILKCAEAGALATGTRTETQLTSSYYNILPNRPLAALLERTMRSLGGVQYDAEETAFGEKLRRTFTPDEGLAMGSERLVQPTREGHFPASTDVGDVSWLAPTAQLVAATYIPGTPNHSWQSVACAGSSIGVKGMALAAKTLALAVLEILHDPQIADEARADFERRRTGFEYRSRIPADAKPPLQYREKK